MKKYLRAFKTQAEYMAFTASTEFILDNVSSCREGDLVYYNSEQCGGQGIHRTISGETYCEGYDKRVYLYKQVSYDDGVTWETTATTSALVERNSEDCGYVPPSYYDITAKFNVTDTSSPTQIASKITNFSKIEIDGVEQPSVVSEYAFSTTGEHTVKYELSNKNIGTEAFSGCSDMTSCSIGDNVTAIGSDAFDDCTGLTSCTIGSGVTSIGEYAFYNCRSLTSIDMPSGVTSIGNGVFYKCSGLTSCTIGSGVTSIGQSAFGFCTSLTSIDIPNSLTNIGNFAFSACTSLTSIDIPSGVTSIGFSAFTSCSGLTSITVNSNNTEYDSRNNCNAIIETSANTLIQGCKNTIIPNSVTTIGNGAFENCSSLTSIVIPNSVTRIYHDVFRGCSSLTSIEIPNSVTSIGGWAFDNCTSLTNCIIGSGVTTIGDYVFYQCSGLTSVTINATTPPTLGGSVFIDTNNCPIYVPCDSVDTYKAANGWSAYASRIQAIYRESITNAVVTCDNTTYNGNVQTAQNIAVTLSGETLVANTDYTVTSNTGGTNAGNYAVVVSGVGCYSGTSNGTFTIAKADSSLSFAVTDLIVEPGETKTNTVTVNAGDGIVTYTSNNTSVVTVNNSGVVTGVGVGSTTVKANISSTSNYNSATTSYNVACAIAVIAKFNVTSTSSPTVIANGTIGFSKIEIDGVVQPRVSTGYTFSTTGEHTVKYYLKFTSIGVRAFDNCSSLTSIEIPDSVTSIGTQAFQSCTSLTSCTIGSSVTSIGDEAFRYCSGLTSCTIGSGVTSIGESAFAICSSLTRLNSNVDGVFNIPSGVTSIGNYAFQACSGMTSIDIPSGVTSIGSMTFYNCSSLTSIDIPSGVTSIGNYVFYNCYSLTSIVCNATTAPTITSDTFYAVKTGGTLTVPSGSSGYNVWMRTLGKYNWTMVEQ